MGAPKPTGIPEALISIIAPQDEPDFLTLRRYFSHSFNTDLSGQKKGVFFNFFIIPIFDITSEQT